MARKFQLKSNFSPKGDQPTAIQKLLDGIESGEKYQTLVGVTGSGKTFTLANVIEKSQKPSLIMAPNKTLAEQLYSEMKEFFPNNAVEYFVSYYDYYQPEAYVPASDTYIEKDASINEQIEQMRLSATKSLLERKDVIIIASVSAIYGLGDPESYMKMLLHLTVGEITNQREILATLSKMQYTRNDVTLIRGHFRVKGEVIDIFPADSEERAIRIEMFDDEVESLSWFDPLTGEKLKSLKRITIYPKTHYVTPESTIQNILDDIKIELGVRKKELLSQNKLVEDQRLSQRVVQDMEMMRELGYCSELRPFGGGAWAEMDDIFALGPAAAVFPAVKRFGEAVKASLNLEMQVSKLECFSPEYNLSHCPWREALGAPVGMVLVPEEDGGSRTYRGVMVAGCPMGEAGFVDAWLRAQVSSIVSYIDKTVLSLRAASPHALWAAIYYSCSAKFDYILRHLPPDKTVSHARVVDAALTRAAEACGYEGVLGDAITARRARLPVRMRGLSACARSRRWRRLRSAPALSRRPRGSSTGRRPAAAESAASSRCSLRSSATAPSSCRTRTALASRASSRAAPPTSTRSARSWGS